MHNVILVKNPFIPARNSNYDGNRNQTNISFVRQ